jgi:N-acetylglucosamine-6-sulfatase
MMLVLAAVAPVGLLLAGDGPLTENGRAGAQVAERPNIVFVMTDELDERSMQDLPGIREVMGSNGTTFENAYVTYSLCCPSRATFLRGQYPHNHGVIGNDMVGCQAAKRRSGSWAGTSPRWPLGLMTPATRPST